MIAVIGSPGDLESKTLPLIHGKPGQVTLISLMNADKANKFPGIFIVVISGC